MITFLGVILRNEVIYDEIMKFQQQVDRDKLRK